MANNKKYYYLKLKETFFNSDEIILIESMQDGMLFSNILLKLYLLSLKFNGYLRLNENMNYTAQMIATLTRHEVGTVERALRVFYEFGLIVSTADGSIYMADIEGMVGESSTEADRKRLARAKFKEGQISDKCPQNVQAMSENRPPEIDIEKEKDIKTETNSDREIYGQYKNVLLSQSEYESLNNNYPNYAKPYIEQLSAL
jgi:predicted phage replisome organizer